VCGWIVAVGYWFIGLEAIITKPSDEEFVFARPSSQHVAHVYVEYTAPEDHTRVGVKDRAYIIRDPDRNIIYGLPWCTEPLISRIRWAEVL
jgi:hypothetical protein